MNGMTFWERVLGLHTRPSERKLLLMKNDAVQFFKKNPRLLAELKKTRSELKNKDIHVRIGCIPVPVRDCLRMMDNAGMPTETRAVISMIIFQIDGIIEEIEEVG